MNNKKGELYRNVEQGKIAGVCAGIADYFGWETWLVRILIVSAVLFGMPVLLGAYVAAWFILDKAPEGKQYVSGTSKESAYSTNEDKNTSDGDVINESIKVKARVWQSGEPAKKALYDIGRKFRSLENKLQNIEQHVTSKEFTVSREINKL